jgi:acyl dehydratase
MSQKMNPRPDQVRAGQRLAPQEIALTTTRIIAAAIATRDYQPVHHDLDVVAKQGGSGIFLNTHTTAGFLECYVQAWAGPDAFIKSVKFRLGVPAYAGDTLHLSGQVAGAPSDDGLLTVKVAGTNALGTHVDGEVIVRLASA